MSKNTVHNKFVNKTIIRVDSKADNMWVFYFSDGTNIKIYAHDVYVGNNMYLPALSLNESP